MTAAIVHAIVARAARPPAALPLDDGMELRAIGVDAIGRLLIACEIEDSLDVSISEQDMILADTVGDWIALTARAVTP